MGPAGGNGRERLFLVRLTLRDTTKGQKPQEVVGVLGLRDRAILLTPAFTGCRAGAIAKVRLQDFQRTGEQYPLRFQKNGGESWEISVRLESERAILAYLEAAGIGGDAKASRCLIHASKATKWCDQCAATSS